MQKPSGNKNRVSDAPVTRYSSAYETGGIPSTLGAVLNEIRESDALATTIAQLRLLYARILQLDDGEHVDELDAAKADYDAKKKLLPAVTFSGTFGKRCRDDLIEYTGVLQADLDHLASRGLRLSELKKSIAIDPHVAFCFESPSGDGLKCGVIVDGDTATHEEAFAAMRRYFVAQFGIMPDGACKDVCRLCFLSHDRDIFISDHPVSFDWRAYSAVDEPEIAVEQDETDIAPLPLNAFPTVMRELAESCASVFRVDEKLPAVSAYTVMAAALGRSVACEGAVNGRTTPANTMSVIGAPPSYGKGVGAKIAAPVIEASEELGDHFDKTLRPRMLAEIAFAEERKREILKDLREGAPTEAKKAQLKDEFAVLEGKIEKWKFEAEQPPCYFTGSATGAALGIALKRNDEQLLSFALEAGDPIRVAAGRFTADQKGDYDLFLSGFTGEPFAEDRTKRKLRLAEPCLSVLWFVQPSLLKELYTTAEAQDRGLLARINVVRCAHDVVPHDDGISREVSPELFERWKKLVRAALKLRQRDSKTIFRATPEAAEVFRFFHNQTVDERNGEGREFEAKLLRGRENAIRIALVFAATDWLEAGASEDAPALTAVHAARGVALAQFFLAETVNLQRGAAAEKRQARLAEILAIVAQAGGRITLRRIRDHHGVGEAELRQIVERNPDKLRIEKRPPGKAGGRPSPQLLAI